MPEKKYHFFWRKESPFSQWHPSNYTLDGHEYSSAEQGMMHGKALLFEDGEVAAQILETNSPQEIKALGREVKGFNDYRWKNHRENIVYRNSLAKFTQNDHLRKALLNTAGLLVEASPYDGIWGIGMDADRARITPATQWKGLNLLGKILTRVREDVRDGRSALAPTDSALAPTDSAKTKMTTKSGSPRSIDTVRAIERDLGVAMLEMETKKKGTKQSTAWTKIVSGERKVKNETTTDNTNATIGVLLDRLKRCEVTQNVLQNTSIGMLVSQLKLHSDPSSPVGLQAKELDETWRRIAKKGESNAPPSGGAGDPDTAVPSTRGRSAAPPRPGAAGTTPPRPRARAQQIPPAATAATTKMNVVRGDLLDLADNGRFDVIVHGCNCFCHMNGGIAKFIKLRWPEAYQADIATEKGSKKKLGTYSHAVVGVSGRDGGVRDLFIVNAYTEYDWRKKRGQSRIVDYRAVRSAFQQIKKDFPGKRIGYPMIGAGLGGGDWAVLKGIIETELNGENHTLVEYAPSFPKRRS